MVEESNFMCLMLSVKEGGCSLFYPDWGSLLFLFDNIKHKPWPHFDWLYSSPSRRWFKGGAACSRSCHSAWTVYRNETTCRKRHYITTEGRSECYLSDPCSDILDLPALWDGKSVPLTTIHQGAAGFEYEMCILVSILLFIMEQKACVYGQVRSSGLPCSFSLHAL